MRIPSSLKRSVFCTFLALLLAVFAGAARPNAAWAMHKPVPEKTGILLAAFGTSVPEATAAIQALKKDTEAAFPGVPVYLAYSSSIIRHKLAREGKHYLSPAQALADMADAKFTKIVVQSLQTIPGIEYTNVEKTAELFQAMPNTIHKVVVGRPLLYFPKDIKTAAAAIVKVLPAHKKGEAVILMGHGTAHPANAAYSALQFAVWQHDPAVYVATVEGVPTIDDIIPVLKKKGVRTAYLVPFMSVAGDHAHNDMAGRQAHSWASKLKAAGITPKSVFVGLGSRPGVAALWMDHLKDAMNRLEH